MTNAFQILLGTLVLALPGFSGAYAQAVRANSTSAALARPVALDEAWPSALNPAALAGLSGFALSLHAARPYHIPALHVARAEVGFGGSGHAVAAAIERLGYDDYAETIASVQAALASATSARTSLMLGVRLAGRSATPRGFTAERSVAVDVGWIATIDSVLFLGAALRSLTGSGGFGTGATPEIAIGAAWSASAALDLLLQVHRERGFPAQLGIGVQTRPHGALAVRAGVSTAPVLLCGGVGIRVRRLHVDFALVSHSVLGLSSSITLSTHGPETP